MNKKVASITIISLLIFTPWIALSSAESPSIHANAGGPYVGTAGIAIQFDGSNSFSSNGNITTYEWYFGDGTFKTGMMPTHTYSHPGTYTLTLTVKDENNNCGTDITQVIINPDAPPTASFVQPLENTVYFRNTPIGPTETSSIIIGPSTIIVEAEDDIGIRHVKFYVDDTLKHIDDEAPYEWNWRIGYFSKTIKAVVVDTSGQETSIEQTVFKWRFHPLPFISAAALIFNGDGNNIFSLIPEKDNDAAIVLTLLKFIFQQNEKSISLFPLLEYIVTSNEDSIDLGVFLENNPLLKGYVKQNYPIIFRLIMISSDSSTEDSALITDHALLRAITLALLKSRFSSDESSILSNDGFYQSGALVNWFKDHPVLTIGSVFLLMTLLLRMRNRNMMESEDSIEDIMKNYDPVARAGGPYSGIVGEPVILSAEGSYDIDGKIISFNWDFGDGNKGSGEIVTHRYLEPGEYTIVLTVTDNDGATAKDTTTIRISTYVEESIAERMSTNAEFWIISGGLSAVLGVGLVMLKFRRRLFE